MALFAPNAFNSQFTFSRGYFEEDIKLSYAFSMLGLSFVFKFVNKSNIIINTKRCYKALRQYKYYRMSFSS